MKKLVLTFAFIAVTQITFAQDAFKNDVKRLVEVSGSTAQIDVAKKQIITMIPEAKQAEFLKEFDATMPSYFQKFYDFYMKEYTHEDVKAMLKFYDSPVGKKINSKAGPMAELTISAAQAWGTELQGILMKYMQQ